MTAILTAVADAVTAELNAHTFEPPFEAARTFVDWDSAVLEGEPETLTVDVVPVSDLKTELDDRGHVRYLAAADVVIRNKFGSANLEAIAGTDTARVKHAAVDPLVALVELVHEYLAQQQRLTELAAAVWVETAIRHAVLHAHLRQHHQFTAIIRATYEVPKALA